MSGEEKRQEAQELISKIEKKKTILKNHPGKLGSSDNSGYNTEKLHVACNLEISPSAASRLSWDNHPGEIWKAGCWGEEVHTKRQRKT